MPAISNATAGLNCNAQGVVSMERPRYFPRQLITPDDLTQEQEYFRARMRRHNRLLHGWGVVCGGEVKAAQADWTVIIQPGYMLSPQGDEILIDSPTSIDLSRQNLEGNAAVCDVLSSDPWCSTIPVRRNNGDTLYIAVAYAECPTRPVRVQAAGCGCDGSQCEYSRIRDSFIVRALPQLPSSYIGQQTPDPSNPFACPPGGMRPCPPCIDDPWVVLATVIVDGEQLKIDNNTYRRYTASYANWWFVCKHETLPVFVPTGAQPT